MVTDKKTDTQACPQCNKRNGYFKVDGSFRCRACNFSGEVKK